VPLYKRRQRARAVVGAADAESVHFCGQIITTAIAVAIVIAVTYYTGGAATEAFTEAFGPVLGAALAPPRSVLRLNSLAS